MIRYFTAPNESLMERLQRQAPQAHFVKAFSWSATRSWSTRVRGDRRRCSSAATTTAQKRRPEILTKFGWETEDMGGVEGARPIEPLCILWCIPGFRGDDWRTVQVLKRSSDRPMTQVVHHADSSV